MTLCEYLATHTSDPRAVDQINRVGRFMDKVLNGAGAMQVDMVEGMPQIIIDQVGALDLYVPADGPMTATEEPPSVPLFSPDAPRRGTVSPEPESKAFF